MRALIAKEIRLVLHPSTYCLIALGVLVLVPSWLYAVILLYGILTAFFNSLNAREMHDLSYTFALPVSRRTMVCGRIATNLGVELAMIAVMALGIGLRGPLGINALEQAPVGMGANVALLGCSFAAFGLFNLVFFGLYYRNPLKVGMPFMVACIPTLLFCGLFEVVPFLPFEVCRHLGEPGWSHLSVQLGVLAVGIAVFVALSLLAMAWATRAFSRYDA